MTWSLWHKCWIHDKVIYRSQFLAQKAADKMSAKNNEEGEDKVHPYKDPDCGYWHVGHLPRRMRGNYET